jgi:REP-associated tyrosine transposase
VYARGNDRQPIFVDDLDRRAYVDLLGSVIPRMGWRCLSYCLMPNHVHLLVETPEANLGRGMCLLQGRYARRFNHRHDRIGHVFQRRYGSVRVLDDAQLWMVIAYIARNPVTADLCATAEDWRWGSHGAIVDGNARQGWLDVPRLFGLVSAVAGGSGLDAYHRCVRGA